jgi:predicted small secreted protein
LQCAPQLWAQRLEVQRFPAWHDRCIKEGRLTATTRLTRDHQLTERGIIMKRLLALALAATFALPSFALLSGCNTVEGAGKDIQKGGEKIKEEAKENKKY